MPPESEVTMKKINVSFCDDDSRIVNITVKEDKKTSRKRISFKDFITAILMSTMNDDSKYRSIGLLPQGYVTGAISATNTKDCKVTLQLPAQIRPMLYYKKIYNIPYPALVFYFEAGKDGHVTVSKCYASAEESLTPDTKLYHYPFGNVYNDKCNICWGNIALPVIEELKDFEKLLTLFFGGSTNDDLWKKGNTGSSTQRELIEKLSKMETFPSEWLSPAPDDTSILF